MLQSTRYLSRDPVCSCSHQPTASCSTAVAPVSSRTRLCAVDSPTQRRPRSLHRPQPPSLLPTACRSLSGSSAPTANGWFGRPPPLHRSSPAVAPRDVSAAAKPKKNPSPSPSPTAADVDPTPQADVEPDEYEEVEQMVGYTPATYISYSDNPDDVCVHDLSVRVHAAAPTCYSIWNDWHRLVDFLDLIGQIGLDPDEPHAGLVQAFYRWGRLPIMELAFLISKTKVEPDRSIQFESLWGMPMAGNVEFVSDGADTTVNLHLEYALPTMLVELKVGVSGVQPHVNGILEENLAVFKRLAEAAPEVPPSPPLPPAESAEAPVESGQQAAASVRAPEAVAADAAPPPAPSAASPPSPSPSSPPPPSPSAEPARKRGRPGTKSKTSAPGRPGTKSTTSKAAMGQQGAAPPTAASNGAAPVQRRRATRSKSGSAAAQAGT